LPQKIRVRDATLEDVHSIREIHRLDDDPWGSEAECAIWTNHRLLRGFVIQVASVRGTVVGHAEWVVSDEPAPYGKHLYLGMLQVHSKHQRRGIGRALVEAGARRAQDLGCPRIKTHPDEQAVGFYRKCGFTSCETAVSCEAAVHAAALPRGWQVTRTVPERVVRGLPMRIGWVQASSAHMWELCNRPARIAGEGIQHPCAMARSGDAYVQLRYLGTELLRSLGIGETAMALAWARATTRVEVLARAAMALACRLPVPTLTYTVQEGDVPRLREWCGARKVGTVPAVFRDARSA